MERSGASKRTPPARRERRHRGGPRAGVIASLRFDRGTGPGGGAPATQVTPHGAPSGRGPAQRPCPRPRRCGRHSSLRTYSGWARRSQTAALADGVAGQTLGARLSAPLRSKIGPAAPPPAPDPPGSGDSRRRPRSRVLALGLRCRGQATLSRHARTSGLVYSPTGKSALRQLAPAPARAARKTGLWPGRPTRRLVAAPSSPHSGIMAGRQVAAPSARVARADSRSGSHGCSARQGFGRAPGGIFRQKKSTTSRLERLLDVDDVERDAQPVGHARAS